jgi:hypothetical protein
MKFRKALSALSRTVRRGALALGVIAALALAGASSSCERAGRGFSFISYGDSRTMMYLPYKEGDPELNELLLDLFDLVLPKKVAEDVLKKDVKLIFDPVTKDLLQIDMPNYGEHIRLTLDQGWVVEATVEDKNLLPGVDRTMFRLAGGTWVAREGVFDGPDGQRNRGGSLLESRAAAIGHLGQQVA